MPTGTPTSPNSESKLNAYVPPKGWEEITSDEKIERLREVIHQLSRSQQTQSQDHNWLKNLFFKHEHSSKGEIITKPETYRQEMIGGYAASTSEKPYF